MLPKKSSTNVRHFLKFLSSFMIGAIVVAILIYSMMAVLENRPSGHSKVTIGILMPMDHEAIREIVAGFKEKVTDQFGNDVVFKVQNSQHDMNLQRSILQQFLRQEVDIIVPIGTAATQLTVAMVKNTPIVSLAANFAEEAREKLGILNITGVIDEIGPEMPMAFLKKFKPNLKKITLIYSNSEKVFPEVEGVVVYGKKIGVEIQKLMIQALPELYTISHLIDADSEAVFVLKDHLIVSGIQTIAKEAQKRRIPIMTSDEGSVKEGATFALGVKEKVIGEMGGILAAKILAGQSLDKLPIERIGNLSIFYNSNAGVNQGIDQLRLEALAKEQGYELQLTEKP